MNQRNKAFQKGLKKIRRPRLTRKSGPIGTIAPTLYNAARMVEPNQIIPGDSIGLLNSGPEGWVDLVFADPPFNIGYQYDQYEDKRDDQEYVQWTCDWIDGCARLLKPTGSMYILIGDEYAAETRLHLKQLERDRKLAFRNWIIWHYTFGQNCKAKFNRSHAHLFYCVGSAALDKWKVSDPLGLSSRAQPSIQLSVQAT